MATMIWPSSARKDEARFGRDDELGVVYIQWDASFTGATVRRRVDDLDFATLRECLFSFDEQRD